MQEVGIDLSGNYPKDVDEFIGNQFDYVVTVCGHAKENCPVFTTWDSPGSPHSYSSQKKEGLGLLALRQQPSRLLQFSHSQ